MKDEAEHANSRQEGQRSESRGCLQGSGNFIHPVKNKRTTAEKLKGGDYMFLKQGGCSSITSYSRVAALMNLLVHTCTHPRTHAHHSALHVWATRRCRPVRWSLTSHIWSVISLIRCVMAKTQKGEGGWGHTLRSHWLEVFPTKMH